MTYQMPSPEIPGWMSADELEWLFQAARRHTGIVEVGSWMGRSTHALLSGTEGDVYSVDTFKGTPSELESTHAFAKDGDVFSEFVRNTGTAGMVTVFPGKSTDVAKRLYSCGHSFDMVFIDADHSYESVLSDLRSWWLLLELGGLFCGHDINEPGVIKALKEFSAEIGREVVREVGIIWSIR